MTFLRPLDSELDDAELTYTTRHASLIHSSVVLPTELPTLTTTTTTTTTKRTALTPSSSSSSPSALSVSTALVLLTQFAYCTASPTVDSDIATRATSDSVIVAREQNDGTVSPKVYIPIVAAFIILLILGGLSWYKTGFKDGILAMTRTSHTGAHTTRRSGNAGNGGAARRELTAAQLTGVQETSGGGAGGATGTGAAGRRGRRGRRPRRTPSQMSVTSLPEYNKEPGDEELVIFRGHDPEDGTIPVDLPRHTHTPDSSHDDSTLQYSYTMNTTLDTSTNNLLQPGVGGISRDSLAEDDGEEDNDDDDDGRRVNRDADADTASGQSSERRSLMAGGVRASVELDARRNADIEARRDSDADIEARGDAPAYFEVVGDGDEVYAMGGYRGQGSGVVGTGSAAGGGTAVGGTGAPGAPGAAPPPIVDLNATVTRKSGFRTFLNRMSLVGSGSHPPLSSATNNTNNTDNVSRTGIPNVPDSSIPVISTSPQISTTTTNTAIDGLPLHHTRNTSALSVYPPSSGPDPRRASSRLSTYTTYTNNIGTGDNTHTGVNSRHRANTSTSTNASRLSLFRPLSRQRSTNTLNIRSGTPSSFSHSHSQLNLHNPALGSRSQINLPSSGSRSQLNLTSPSMNSLHSLISSPLPHTLTRTEITYPVGGPTAEQVRMLSGRESVGRFGVPFGEEAVRWARGAGVGVGVGAMGAGMGGGMGGVNGSRSNVNLVGDLNASRSVVSLNGGGGVVGLNGGGRRSNVNLNGDDMYGYGYEVPPPGFDEVVGGGGVGGGVGVAVGVAVGAGMGAGMGGRGHERGESTGSLGVPVPSRFGVDGGVGWNNGYINTTQATGNTNTTINSNTNTTTNTTTNTNTNTIGNTTATATITVDPPSRGVSRRNTAEVYERHEDEKEREGSGDGDGDEEDGGGWGDDEKNDDEMREGVNGQKNGLKELGEKNELKGLGEKNELKEIGEKNERQGDNEKEVDAPVVTPVKIEIDSKVRSVQAQPPTGSSERSVDEFGAIVAIRQSRAPGFSTTAPLQPTSPALESTSGFPTSAQTFSPTSKQTFSQPTSLSLLLSHNDADTNSQNNSNLDANSHAHANANINAHVNAHTNTNTHAHAHANTNINAPHAKTNINDNADSYYRSESRTSTYSSATMDSFRTAESYETVGEGEGRESRMSGVGGRMSGSGGMMTGVVDGRNESRIGERNESRSTYYTDFDDDDSEDARSMRRGGSDVGDDTDDEEGGNEGRRRRDTVIGHAAQSVNGKRDTVIAPSPASLYAIAQGHSSMSSSTRDGSGVVSGAGGAVNDNEDDEEPTTPKLGNSRHLQEASDATVVQR